ncbi:class I SAM-dependent methyltransferase [Fulvivirga sp. M361]|uniref:class I SAM-dependent methyltransferase n=1 Tax=Fulvivirga sp. M361 TaxID=2594266 RepID=UPI00210431C6|nr:class I SAM-dependent methyltransferase [Fulvivirga sp. M361]
MQSATAKKDNAFARKLVNFHQKASHSNRISILSRLIAQEVKEISDIDEKTNCLDVGCGDMALAELVYAQLPSSDWQCIDVFELSDELKKKERWKKYSTFDGQNIPFPDKQFKAALFCDVLHHADHTIDSLLNEASRVADYVIIKDHFEYGFFSRQWLRVMDFIGNWGYGVNIPKRYFSEYYFKDLCHRHDLKIAKMKIGINLYSHLPFVKWIAKPKWQFVAVLKT